MKAHLCIDTKSTKSLISAHFYRWAIVSTHINGIKQSRQTQPTLTHKRNDTQRLQLTKQCWVCSLKVLQTLGILWAMHVNQEKAINICVYGSTGFILILLHSFSKWLTVFFMRLLTSIYYWSGMLQYHGTYP